MSYVLNQFNQARINAEDVNSSSNTTYMTQITGGTARRRKSALDSGVSGASLDPFYDECVQLDSSLAIGLNYYFHAKIKRMEKEQVFYIYLVNYESSSAEDTTQYLKTITVQGGSSNDWVDFEIVFSPLINFDCILFQLQRTIDDYRDSTRYPTIIYEELSRLNNVITSKIAAGVGLIKMGIQSHPGLMMCINGEEIHIGRSGVYEIRNGVIGVEFLSIVSAAEEASSSTLSNLLEEISGLDANTSSSSTNSQCIFDWSKVRSIDPFTLDYMYKEE